MANEKPKPFSALSKSDVAALLCCTKRQIDNYVEQGMPKNGDGRGSYYAWDEVFKWYIAFKIADAKRKSVSTMPDGADPDIVLAGENMAQAVLRKTSAEASLKELELAEARGEVVAVDDVEKNVAAVAKSIQTKLLAVPTKLASQLAAARGNKAQIRSTLTTEMRQVCADLVSVEWQTAEAKA